MEEGSNIYTIPVKRKTYNKLGWRINITCFNYRIAGLVWWRDNSTSDNHHNLSTLGLFSYILLPTPIPIIGPILHHSTFLCHFLVHTPLHGYEGEKINIKKKGEILGLNFHLVFLAQTLAVGGNIKELLHYFSLTVSSHSMVMYSWVLHPAQIPLLQPPL